MIMIINKNMKKKYFKKAKILVIVFLIIFSFNLSFSNLKIANAQAEEKAAEAISNLSSPTHGLMPCDPYSEIKEEQCHPADAIKLLKVLIQIAMYLIIISLVLMLIISGVGYVYSGNPQFLSQWKKRIKNSIYALLILMLGIGVVLGLLAALGMKNEVVNLLKNLLANIDIFSIKHSFAADPISDISDKTSSSLNRDGIGYINFFPNQTVPSLILLSIKFFINYIAAPALVGATIWAGFLFVKAEGNADALKKAKSFALRVVVGIIIAAAASTSVSVLLNTINNVTEQTKIERVNTNKENSTSTVD